MNSDEMMSDTTVNTTKGVPPLDLLQNNSSGGGSLADVAAAAAAAKAGAGPAAWNTKKFRDEYEMAKTRLSDQKFNIAEYPDPLLPRRVLPRQYPLGVTAETERQLQELIANIRVNGAA
ncbi:hypothetical protein B0T26DRAFT_746300 [Lasiosphaeria miniovina]|uniref:Uncharacterized protein n=1 Tax=Lasiosphaeria miniovina TaxID=1954250 RepID=A0AA40BHL5_9PEZI|nr:uncharacterized protein B0T26DRAFT_746300 [Lasiosphaeria miniovina]KAK0734383.1 hypothetical protein B0T26DRAFT_746300 [Lasiosphaeria miniovina]